MTHSLQPIIIDNDTVLMVDETGEAALADQAAVDLFDDENNACKTSGVIADFVDSYTRHKNTLPLEEWLDQEFAKYPGIWVDDAERHETALKVIETVQKNNDEKADLYAHLNKGKSRESWLAKKIEQGASSTGVVDIGKYAQGIDNALEDANIEMMDKVYKKFSDADEDLEGLVASSATHLHGFIAEVDLANQFNVNATASGSTLKAEVLRSIGKNSPDILIKDSAGNMLEHIQVKLYKPGEDGLNSLITNIKKHGYDNNTTLIVNEEHVAALRDKFPDLKISSDYQQNGVTMKMGKYAEYKKLQEKAQLTDETKQYQWSDANRMNIAKEIGKKALIAAAFSAGFQGARILGRRTWNTLNGKENRSANEDLQEFFESSIKSAANVGVQVAVSGALVVAVKSGWVKALQGTPAGVIANIANIAIANAKCVYKFAQGELSAVETLDAMTNITYSAIGGIEGAFAGGALGMEIGFAFGPIGVAVGGFVGSVIGSIAGSTINEAIYKAHKTIVKTAVKVIQSAWEGTKAVAKGAFNTAIFGLFA
ncbi:MAG: hypothetical protein Q8L68_01035 [Methylococcales bacterium]|nr:hypothetical protein [Methylococcales bacterium]